MTTTTDNGRDTGTSDTGTSTDRADDDILDLGPVLLGLILLLRRAIRENNAVLAIRTGDGRVFVRPQRLSVRRDGSYVLRARPVTEAGRPIPGAPDRDIPLASIEDARRVRRGGAAQTRLMARGAENPSDPLSMPEGLLRLVALTLEAIETRTRLIITYWDSERLIEPLRLWLQPDNTYLLEAYQVAGGAGGGKGGAVIPSPFGGVQGFLSYSVEKIQNVRASRGPFTIRRGFAPDSERRYGRLLGQVSE